ncbi:ADP-ribosylglycohydrolase family protein [Anaeromyxobacter soli]|uniref:ADP-ribosylglycohydrolase family protein n=1 Tax=Anaeromyxobacter soli TaxID=2922725 RepID=UPI001FB048D7|nr:ADP-ribosylglycohydrolase family protein [Anaeromyxobacter sp. SG29]
MTGRGTRTRDAFRGCLLGGAVGDALGAPIEFMKLEEIRNRFGSAGVTGLEQAYGRRGAITDDTQMTLFTAEALIRALHRFEGRGIVSISDVARGAYLRWLTTQGERARTFGDPGWLVGVPELHSLRAPGNTCLAALRSGGSGTPEHPINDSKGCGGVMRVAPVGLARAHDPFRIGSEVAALTHGHPSGHLAAGCLALVVSEVSDGAELRDACRGALGRLEKERGHEETTAAVEGALELAAEEDPSPEAVESLGAGWVAEEALAIGLYCALVAKDFAHGVLLAVNHGGDSDSTGSIAGNLLGLLVGERGIPGQWLEELELRDVITTVADDLWRHFGPEAQGDCVDDLDRYPPN